MRAPDGIMLKVQTLPLLHKRPQGENTTKNYPPGSIMVLETL
jgi:hypothetical protein